MAHPTFTARKERKKFSVNTRMNPRTLRFVPPASSVSTITVMLMLAIASLVHSATNKVTSLADSGAGSLRQAIASSASGDPILFGVTGTITLTSGELVISPAQRSVRASAQKANSYQFLVHPVLSDSGLLSWRGCATI